MMEDDIIRLEQFVWLIDNDDRIRTRARLQLLWKWAGDLAEFQRRVQEQATSTGNTMRYRQRGKLVKRFYPAKRGTDA